MNEIEQISKQIFTREGKVYNRWYQLYPALLHLCVITHVIFTTAHHFTHSNCQPDNSVVWDDHLNSDRPRWGPFVTIARQYKWVWLNRGDGTATVRSKTIEQRSFWDELAFEEGFPRLNP